LSTKPNRTVIDDFHKLYYGSADETWKSTFWFGITVHKCPLDLWIYQEIIHQVRPDLIVETGTLLGGSAYYMACILDLLGKGEIVTIDINDYKKRPKHKRIDYLHGSSTDDAMFQFVKGYITQSISKVMVVLDSHHSKEHVLKEMELYGPLVSPGSYMIVEDTNINGHPVIPDIEEGGPMEAVDEYLRTHPEFESDRSRERLLLTFNPRGFLRRLV